VHQSPESTPAIATRGPDALASPVMRSIAPVEYVLIAFPGNQFTGGIAPAIADLVESGTVHILDLVFVKKDVEGNILCFEFDDLPETSAYADIDGQADGFLATDDVIELADVLEPESSALLIVWEDLWAAKLGAEINASGGVLVAGGRLPHDLVTAVLSDIEGDNS
jgi:Family of unknown function (DUF6325)